MYDKTKNKNHGFYTCIQNNFDNNELIIITIKNFYVIINCN